MSCVSVYRLEDTVCADPRALVRSAETSVVSTSRFRRYGIYAEARPRAPRARDEPRETERVSGLSMYYSLVYDVSIV